MFSAPSKASSGVITGPVTPRVPQPATDGPPALSKWRTTRVLILGMTYPSYSGTYTEHVCTGGIEEGTLRMVRIHPIPRRYMDPGQRFTKFQWVRLGVKQHSSDPRPESLQVDPKSIELEEVIPPSKATQRRDLILKSPHFFRSVEELHERQKEFKTSLGAIRPKEIRRVYLAPRSAEDRRVWLAKERSILGQKDIFGEKIKKLDFPEMYFRIVFLCDDERCTKTHDMALMDWGLHELWRKLRKEPDGEKKLTDRMWLDLDLSKRDVFFFLGNYRDTMFNFGLMGTVSPEREPEDKQMTLL